MNTWEGGKGVFQRGSFRLGGYSDLGGQFKFKGVDLDLRGHTDLGAIHENFSLLAVLSALDQVIDWVNVKQIDLVP